MGSREPLLAVVASLTPRIRACRDEIERGRRLPPALARELAEAGVFRAFVPRALGGAEVDLATLVRAIEALARADGSAGWCAMIGMGSGAMLAFLPEAAARRIFADPNTIFGGAAAPTGRAVAVPGGYRVGGRWRFGSGIDHCAWMGGNCLVYDGEALRLGPDGAPEVRMALLPAGAFAVVDVWRVAGLRGTGSNDFIVRDLFVPAEHTYAFFTGKPAQPGPAYAFPVTGQLAVIVAGVALGVARAAIETLAELAQAKTPTGQTNLLRERAAVQADVAKAEALLRAGRAFLYESIDAVWQTVCAGATVPVEQRALLRLAATTAALNSAQAVDLMYNAGGATAIYESSPLERCFRDVHVITQHIMVALPTLESVGRALLGLKVASISL